MKDFLRVIGTVVIVLGVLAGIFSRSLLLFFAYVIGSVISSIIYFVLAQLLENQELILMRLNSRESDSYSIIGGQPQVEMTHKCLSCGKQVGIDRTSCPYCGSRNFL